MMSCYKYFASILCQRNAEVLELFTLLCTIVKCTFDVMLDLGALINVMPSSVYRSLRLGALEPIGAIIQLENKSISHPHGILEDMLMQVSDMIFPVDFYLLDMKDELSSKGPILILCRPFLKIARTKIDVHARTFSIEFGDSKVEYRSCRYYKVKYVFSLRLIFSDKGAHQSPYHQEVSFIWVVRWRVPYIRHGYLTVFIHPISLVTHSTNCALKENFLLYDAPSPNRHKLSPNECDEQHDHDSTISTP
ncbi:hypothetical protein CR513_04192, partial [Mucuna pruriens]